MLSIVGSKFQSLFHEILCLSPFRTQLMPLRVRLAFFKLCHTLGACPWLKETLFAVPYPDVGASIHLARWMLTSKTNVAFFVWHKSFCSSAVGLQVMFLQRRIICSFTHASVCVSYTMEWNLTAKNTCRKMTILAHPATWTRLPVASVKTFNSCLLYTSDAADE